MSALRPDGDGNLDGAGFDVVIPTVGRPCLSRLLLALDGDSGPTPGRVLVIDDRREPGGPLELPELTRFDPVVVRSDRHGPAAARNAGWRRCTAAWICFLDDDVVPRPGWSSRLAADLLGAPSGVAAIQGRVTVPLPGGVPPSDLERNVAGLQEAAWITADMAIRRNALVQVGGFDERFERAYREDTDLALRLMDAGHLLAVGDRRVDHPVRPAPWWVSVPAQRGNADDALMRRLHGPDWRARGRAPGGMLSDHLGTTAVGAVTFAAALAGRPVLATLAGSVWVRRWARFWNLRRSAGRDRANDLVALALTSLAIPPAASYWALTGLFRARRLAPGGPSDRWSGRAPELVLFDRDGTLVHDVPYNGDPDAVVPVPGAREALDRLRSRGVAVGLITNQSGVARGLIEPAQVQAVNDRVSALLGPFATVQVCPHGPGDGCGRRKPAPGMVLAAADAVGVAPDRCAVVGDIGSDVMAGLAAGARSVLVPTPVTESLEVESAPDVARDLAEAVDALLSGRTLGRSGDRVGS
jgi:HAD superfamily hydrolase (TIGR01662 family)